ncbi:hypothetical protein ACQP3C_30385, partial [Escherichia coli]
SLLKTSTVTTEMNLPSFLPMASSALQLVSVLSSYTGPTSFVNAPQSLQKIEDTNSLIYFSFFWASQDPAKEGVAGLSFQH